MSWVPRPSASLVALVLAAGLLPSSFAGPRWLAGQSSGVAPQTLDRVLAFPAPVGEEWLDPDRGAMGAWQRIRKLGTTASLLHVTAHPDDEHSGMLTLASRGWGARTALLSLNRGEAGANAIGPELFDGLGLIRTRELVLAGRYYGLDDLYFTTAVDYGYSKTVAEAFRSWERDAVLEDMVRVIRLNRPLVVVARFHGSERDGHGHHHGSGLLTPEAVAAAADPARFPRQIEQEGLRPWRVLRTFRGGVREGEPYHVEVDATGASPWLGTTYQRWASRGLGLQRSQTAGRVRAGGGSYRYEQRGGSDGTGAASFFAELDTSLSGLPGLLGEAATPEVGALLAELQGLIDETIGEFDFRAPSRSTPGLVRGLGLLRAAIAGSADTPETRFHLSLKERQFEDAIAAASGLRVEAVLPGGATAAVVVPGDGVTVRVAIGGADAADVLAFQGRIEDRAGNVLGRTSGFSRTADGFVAELDVRLSDADQSGPAFAPYFSRAGLAQNHYQIADSADLHLPWRRAALSVAVDLEVEGTTLVRTAPLTAPVARLPYGSVTHPVEVLPALSVVVDPAVRVVPVDGPDGSGGGATGPGSATAASVTGAPEGPTTASRRPAPDVARSVTLGQAASTPVTIHVRVTANTGPLAAQTRLEVPAGWTAAPATAAHDFRRPGEIAEVAFEVTPPDGWAGAATVQAVSRADGTEYRAGYTTIDHRDLRLARLWRPATTTVRSVPVARLDGAHVGYVMGVGDEVHAAIEALGARVDLLDEAALADPDALTGLDAIVVGTRAYAVRPDLLEHNQRLIEYARAGGNLVILYQTQEFVPEEMAPYPASLPRGAEEVSEEDAPVRLLLPDHPVITAPNRITEADFDGWVEQRGSKFFTEWDPAYTPLVETHDQSQAPQEGIWLTAEVGEGHYTYLALALHRQLPYGVPGAFRILSNVLSPRGAP